MMAKYKNRQTGAALFTALIFLLILTLIGVTALKDSGLSERMSANAQISQMAFNAAESAMDRYIAEYNYNINAPASTEAEIDRRTAYTANFIPLDTNSYVEYCLDDTGSVLSSITDESGNQIINTSVDCEAADSEVYLDSVATVAKNRVNYEGCPGSCPKYSLGLGKQKVSCHILSMQAEGKVDQTTAVIDQWVSLQGPC